MKITTVCVWNRENHTGAIDAATSTKTAMNLKYIWTVGWLSGNMASMWVFLTYIWKDYINLIGELYGCKDFSGEIQFKVHLK